MLLLYCHEASILKILPLLRFSSCLTCQVSFSTHTENVPVMFFGSDPVVPGPDQAGVKPLSDQIKVVF